MASEELEVPREVHEQFRASQGTPGRKADGGGKAQKLPQAPCRFKCAIRLQTYFSPKLSIWTLLNTPGSMSSLFGDFFRELCRGILGGVSDYLGYIGGICGRCFGMCLEGLGG